MTLERLKNLYHLQSEIDLLQERIEKLKGEAEQITPKLSHAPGGNTDDKLGKIIAQYVDLQNELIAMRETQIAERNELERYINAIPDAQTRMILYLRFCEHRTWEQVALKLGGYNSADNCRMIAMRYIKTNM